MSFLSSLLRPISIEAPSPTEAVRPVVMRLLAWQEWHRDRKHLGELDDRTLKDIGLTRADVERELNKSFWRH